MAVPIVLLFKHFLSIQFVSTFGHPQGPEGKLLQGKTSCFFSETLLIYQETLEPEPEPETGIHEPGPV